MKSVHIVMPFTLTLNDGSQRKFTPGVVELEDDIAEHWYVRAHSQNPPRIPPAAGTPEYAQEQARSAARRRLLDAAAEEAAREEQEKSESEHRETVRRKIVTDAELNE
jgi:hypothetical protein